MNQSWSVYDTISGIETIVLARSDIEACNTHLSMRGIRSDYVSVASIKVYGSSYYFNDGRRYGLANGKYLEVFRV